MTPLQRLEHALESQGQTHLLARVRRHPEFVTALLRDFAVGGPPGSGSDAESPLLVYDRMWDDLWNKAYREGFPVTIKAKGKSTEGMNPLSAQIIRSSQKGKTIPWLANRTKSSESAAYRASMQLIAQGRATKDMNLNRMPEWVRRPLYDFIPDLRWFDLIVLNTSGGKDSAAMQAHMTELMEATDTLGRGWLVHCDLGESEHEGTHQLVKEHARVGRLPLQILDPGERKGRTLLERFEERSESKSKKARKRKSFGPGHGTRYCTSEYKTGEVAVWINGQIRKDWGTGDLIKKLGRRIRVLNVLGLRSEESDMRAHRTFKMKKETQTRSQIQEWLPIQGWTEAMVWEAHDRAGLRRHPAYAAGFKRLSCTICPLAGHDEGFALGVLTYPEVAERLAAIERRTGKTFKEGVTIAETIERAERDPILVAMSKRARAMLDREKRSMGLRRNPAHTCPDCRRRAEVDPVLDLLWTSAL